MPEGAEPVSEDGGSRDAEPDGRVCRRLQEGPIQGCADFQALLMEDRGGMLSPARRLLLEDHLGECVVCRKAAEGRVTVLPPRRAAVSVWRSPWAIAAGAAVVLAAAAWFLWRPAGGRITVASLDGAMFRVAHNQVAPLAPGSSVAAGGEVRTGKESGAVIQLSDGSRVEVRERSSFTVSESGGDVTVHLNRGALIVEAAGRRFGRLYVATRDCTVEAAGTVFSVNAGVKGSRVAVFQGEVRVARGDERRVLKAGEQYSTDPSVASVALRDEIAWSRNPDRYVELLRKLARLEKKFEQFRLPELRDSSRLTALLPAGTALVVTIPNVGTAIVESRKLIEEQAAQSPAIREWMEESPGSRDVIRTLDLLGAGSEYLGEKIVVAAAADEKGGLADPLLLAEMKKPGFEAFLRAELRKAGARETPPMKLHGNVIALAATPAALERLSGGFAATPLAARLNEVDHDGAGLVAALDAVRLGWRTGTGAGAQAPVTQLVLEQKLAGGRTGTHVTVFLRESNSGPASWLGEPAPIGALDFVSPEAAMAAAFVLKNPARVLEELAASNPNVPPEIRELGASLGGEFAFAFDGVGLPLMSWKLAAEVYDPLRFESSLERIIAMASREAEKKGKKELRIRQEVSGGRTYYLVSLAGAGQFGEAAYTFTDGYLVAAASRALVDRALQYRSSGYALARSSDFARLAPRDRHTNFSGMFYHNLGPSLGPLAELFAAGAEMKAEHRQAIRKFASELKPVLVTVSAARDRITVASSSSLFGLSPVRLAGLPGPLAMMEWLGQKAGTARGKPAY